jgi:hypothetical protein
MNTLADNALFEAFLCGRSAMTQVDVERAHRDLGWNKTAGQSAATQSTETTPAPEPSATPAMDEAKEAAANPELQATLDELDSELASVFSATEAPSEGPPKDEEPEPADLLVELVED